MDYFSIQEDPQNVNSLDNKCQTCGKSFKKKSKLNRHIRETHLNLKDHVCSFCQKKFKRNSHLKRHLVIHGEDPKPFLCSYPGCFLRFLDKYHLERHIKVKHTYEFRLKCEQCSLSFDKKISLYRHAFQVHAKPKPFECKECGKGFFKSFLLNKHQAAHVLRERKLSNSSRAASKKGKTTTQNKKSKTESENQRLHQENSTIKHDIFNEEDEHFDDKGDLLWLRKFSFSERLSPHAFEDSLPRTDVILNQEPSAEEPKLASTRLGKNISNYSNLFICFYENCQKVYTTPYNLKTHIRTKHLKSKDFVCPYCKSSFYHGKSLREHLKKKHEKSEGDEESKVLESIQNDLSPKLMDDHPLDYNIGQIYYEGDKVSE